MNEKVVFVRETIFCDVSCIYRMPYDTRGKTLSRATKYEGVAHMLFLLNLFFVCVTCFVVSNEEKDRYREDLWDLTPTFFAKILMKMINQIFNKTVLEDLLQFKSFGI
jgi:hypothetical protein